MPRNPKGSLRIEVGKSRKQKRKAKAMHDGLLGTVADTWGQEVADRIPLGRPFDSVIKHTQRVSPCLVCLESNRYSVPTSSANRPDSARIYPQRIVIAADSHFLYEHGGIIERSLHLPGRTVYEWRHYLAGIQRRPGALRNGEPGA